jgi:thiopurine S-methyltransferase
MDEDLWRKRWAEGRIGFHEPSPNPFLRAYATRLFGAGSAAPRVLVPLSGKSTDLAFLAELGCSVTGIELVREAVTAFFEEQALVPTASTWHGFESLCAGSVRLAVGDFFELALPESERFDAAYDRAALIALRPEERRRYVTTLMAALKPGARILLVTFAYDAPPAGPPYSVSEEDVRELYASCGIERLATEDLTATEARFVERGATFVLEQVFAITLP